MHAVLSVMLLSVVSNWVDIRLVDAPVSTMAVPYLYSPLELSLSRHLLAMAIFDIGRSPSMGF